ncbi:MAG: ABC transporter ATP-binding protein [Burkholderiaceae bacterium]
MISIAASGLEKHFGLTHEDQLKRAVDGVTFSIAEGERVGFIGANGAGKTTLLQMLAGIAEPTGGSLNIAGKVTAIFTLGMGLRDDFSGLENIYIEGELQGRAREETEKIIHAIVEFAELGEFIDRPVRTYSTGMKARLAFSTIVHIDPEVLIVDEALSVGDARFSAKATRKMKELTQRGKILILVSHSMGSIQDMCTRCIWLEAGKIKLDGQPAEVTKAYLEQVHKDDDGKLFERFRRELVDESSMAGWKVESMGLQTGLDTQPVRTLVTGESAALTMVVHGPAGCSFDAKLLLRRLDGLVVRESLASDSAASLCVSENGSVRVTMDFGELPLNYGTFLARIDVLVGPEIAARRSTLFEVINPRPHKGGRPVLVTPSRFNVTRVPA